MAGIFDPQVDNSTMEAEWEWRKAVVDHANREFPQNQQMINQGYGDARNAVNQYYGQGTNALGAGQNQAINTLSQVPGMSYNTLANGYNLGTQNMMGAGGSALAPSYAQAPSYGYGGGTPNPYGGMTPGGRSIGTGYQMPGGVTNGGTVNFGPPDNPSPYGGSQNIGGSTSTAPPPGMPWQGGQTYSGAQQGTGLIGSTDTLNAGLGSANQTLGQTGQNAVNSVGSGVNRSNQILGGALNTGMNAIGAGMDRASGDVYGMAGQGFAALGGAADAGMGAISSYGGQGFGALGSAGSQGMGAIGSYIGQGADQLSPYQEIGGRANTMQSDMNGLNGPEAQQAAIDRAMASPEFQFMQDQGELGVTRQAAALGGLGGGNVMKELSRFNQGLASQRFDSLYNRLGGQSQMGATASGQAAGLYGQGAGYSGSLQGTLGSAGASLGGSLAGAGAGLQGSLGSSGASLAGSLGSSLGQIGSAGGIAQGNLAGSLGEAGANNTFDGGVQAGQFIDRTGQQQAANTMGFGGIMAGNQLDYGNRAGDMAWGGANVLTGQYPGLAGMGADVYTGTAQNMAGQYGNQAQILANTYGNQVNNNLDNSFNRWNLMGGYGAYTRGEQSPGIGTQLLNAASTAIGATRSDERLKENVKKIGELESGLNVYRWQWTDEAKEIVGDQPTFGVMAQEVQKVIPEAVSMGDDGFLRVDYGRIH